eukprot:TRINITY_DN8030_c0_g1_i1.p1 TRINITY_DN8030_c0_g1~~TRINITY_DN8030_c0_g1_i1.p1  ORF type:complete len:162 (+),score=19.56 TRINITY_DN8030_c0_g1_i1:84-569(+)
MQVARSLGRVIRKLDRHMMDHPWGYAVGTGTIKTCVADLMIQTVFEEKKLANIDKRRNMVFTLFGLFYLGGFQYMLYCNWIPRMFPGNTRFDLFKKVVVDQFLHHPFVYFPTFYYLNELIRGGDISSAMENYRNEGKESLFACWKIWLPAQVTIILYYSSM